MVLKSPFQYPYYNCYLDVTGKRKPQIDNLIDQLLNSGKFNEFQAHNKKILLWKEKCNKQIDNSKLKKYRRSQFDKCIDDDNAFKFYLTRQQTRYKQRNYVKKAYKVTQTVNAFFCNYEYLQNRDRALQRINCLLYTSSTRQCSFFAAENAAAACIVLCGGFTKMRLLSAVF